MQKLVLLPLLFVALSAQAQHNHSDHAHGAKIQVVKGDAKDKPLSMGPSSMKLLDSDIEITGGYGQGHFFKEEKNQTQKLINQGYAMLNMFQYTDAFRSFQTAVKYDPTSVEAQIGRGFASIFLDGSQHYYLLEIREFLFKNKMHLNEKQRAWSSLLLVMFTGADIEGVKTNLLQEFTNLKKIDPENIETDVFANWIAGAQDMEALRSVLKKDPNNAGATHYLLHLNEFKGIHKKALFYGVKLKKIVLGSGHGQHMYGHVLPHFNRWREADEQFTIANEIHQNWSKKNGVAPGEDWHYSHNLDLWSVTKMVLNPAQAILILEELTQFSDNYILDLLDLRTATSLDLKSTDDYINRYERKSESLKQFISSSRKLHTLIDKVDEFDAIKYELIKGLFQDRSKDVLLHTAIFLIHATREGDVKLRDEAMSSIIESLSSQFSEGGFDGWRRSVLETLVYTRIFEAYGLKEAASELRTKISNVYVNPVD